MPMNPKRPHYRRISESLSNTSDLEFDVIVVGSGYGAGVAASRLARAGRRVCVLERGKEIAPGDFPNSISSSRGEMQIDSKLGREGDPEGLFDVRLNDDMNALVGCGLGGTSLINANVALEVKKDLFSEDAWPEAFRKDPNLLDEYYDVARSVLDPSPYPSDFPTLNKLVALEKSADFMGETFYRPPINVNFESRTNAFGVEQPACVGCGDCCSGCNYGAKNTTQMNYLPDAHNHGAVIVTGASVRHLSQREDESWDVHVIHTQELTSDPKEAAPRRFHAPIVVLGAGALGSTEILLRSKEEGLRLSPALGSHFSGNGDVLAFGYNNLGFEEIAKPKKGQSANYPPINGVGAGSNKLSAAQMPGPTIAGIIDMRDETRIENRLVIEEGVIPGALASVLTPTFFFADTQDGNFFQYGLSQVQPRLEQAKALATAVQTDPGNLTMHAYSGPVARTQTYLVMSHDDAEGLLKLEDDRLRIDWPGVGASATYHRDNQKIKEASDGIQGQYIPNPISSKAMGEQLVTVHPVGGCRMADDFQNGVVDDTCRVYSGEGQRYSGLYVCDGSVMPMSLGVNPLLTISAIAERACDVMIKEHDWLAGESEAHAFLREQLDRVDASEAFSETPTSRATQRADAGSSGVFGWFGKLLHGIGRAISDFGQGIWHELRSIMGKLAYAILKVLVNRFPDAFAPGLSFTETMEGWITKRVDEHPLPAPERISSVFTLAARRAEIENESASFKLTIGNSDLNEWLTNPDHIATATGEVTCVALSSKPMKVAKGTFKLLPVDPNRVETWVMVYDLELDRDKDDRVFLHGKKFLHKEPGSSAWTDLTTLFVEIWDLPEGESDREVLARGILQLDLRDFIRQGFTMSLSQSHGWINRIGILRQAVEFIFAGRFAGFFGMAVMQSYGGLLSDLANFAKENDKARKHAGRRKLDAPDPKFLPLKAGDGAQLKLTRYRGGSRGPVVLAPGYGVTASSFAADTVDQNVVEALCKEEYDVWLFDYRASPDSGSSTTNFCVDDIAKYDWPAAVAKIRQETGAPDVQAVVHCVGSMSCLMALLDGMDGIRSVISSQLTLHPVTNWMNTLKADGHFIPILKQTPLVGDVVNMRSGTTNTDLELNVALWNFPIPPGEECSNPTCKRIFAVFGPSYRHSELNHATHEAIREWFGPISTSAFEQLSLVIERGYTVDAKGEDTYLPNVARLKLPITFLAGELNLEFLPETSARTLAWLQAHNGEKAYYKREVVPNYGHMDFWIGRNAARDIFPKVLEALEEQDQMKV